MNDLIHHNPSFSIYFGNDSDILNASNYQNAPSFAQIKKSLHLQHLTFARQVDGADGALITGEQDITRYAPFSFDGDYLITNVAHVGIGVMNANSLPIIFYDPVHHVIAVAHAGWRSSAQHIASNILETMHTHFKTQARQVRVYFGPSAKVCCYKVEESFANNLDAFSFAHLVLQRHGDDLMFDLPLFNRLQLENLGLDKAAVRFEYNICTICNPHFSCYRSETNDTYHQMTVVSLK